MSKPILKYEVIKSRVASYLDPISVKAGELLTFDGRKDIWDGHTWLWAINPTGKQGWIPDNLITPDAPDIAQEDYTAVELTCKYGQILVAQSATHGWVFCCADDGQCGWVPDKNLIRIYQT